MCSKAKFEQSVTKVQISGKGQGLFGFLSDGIGTIHKIGFLVLKKDGRIHFKIIVFEEIISEKRLFRKQIVPIKLLYLYPILLVKSTVFVRDDKFKTRVKR